MTELADKMQAVKVEQTQVIQRAHGFLRLLSTELSEIFFLLAWFQSTRVHEPFISDFKAAHESIGGRLKLITEFCIQLGEDNFVFLEWHTGYYMKQVLNSQSIHLTLQLFQLCRKAKRHHQLPTWHSFST